MLFDFFFTVRKAGVPASVKEFLTLLEALDRGVIYGSVDDFYALSRLTLVKDEAYFDRFDLAFAEYFKGVESIPDAVLTEIPAAWLKKLAEKWLTDEEKKKIEALGGWDKLMETLRERLPSRRRATRAAASGSVRPARHRMARMATTPRASASARKAAAIAAP